MKINSFKGIAYQILLEAKKPLHCKEITKIARKRGWLITAGKTPEQTMCAVLNVDVNSEGKKSRFEKVKPSTFRINPVFRKIPAELIEDKIFKISKNITTKQKGDIAEARIAELITLYGNKNLACYKPLSDDEGIDLIVKEKKKFKTIFVQIKSRFGDNPRRVFVSTTKFSNIKKDGAMAVIFCFFDTQKGDIWDYLWLIPAPDFIEKANRLENGRLLCFVSGMSKERESNKWNKYLIDKKDLANRIIELKKKANRV